MKGGVRGKHVKRLRAGSNPVLLEPDLAAAYPTDAAVNKALCAALRCRIGGKGPQAGLLTTRPAGAPYPSRRPVRSTGRAVRRAAERGALGPTWTGPECRAC